jgi:hypothetical protein
MNVTQIKDAIRYMSRSDKIEIYRWLDGELAGDLPLQNRNASLDYNPPRIERMWKENRNSEQPDR